MASLSYARDYLDRNSCSDVELLPENGLAHDLALDRCLGTRALGELVELLMADDEIAQLNSLSAHASSHPTLGLSVPGMHIDVLASHEGAVFLGLDRSQFIYVTVRAKGTVEKHHFSDAPSASELIRTRLLAHHPGDEQRFRREYARIARLMRRTHGWFYVPDIFKGNVSRIDFANAEFREVRDEKHLALGRSTYYDEFIRRRQAEAGHPVYQSDYMAWIDPPDPYTSLMYYIDTADTIDFNLQGISVEDVQGAAKLGRRARDRRDLRTPYMTCWEINQILFTSNCSKATWFVTQDQSEPAVRAALGLACPDVATAVYRV